LSRITDASRFFGPLRQCPRLKPKKGHYAVMGEQVMKKTFFILTEDSEVQEKTI